MTNHGAEERGLGDRGCHLSWVPFDCTPFFLLLLLPPPPHPSPSASSSTSQPFLSRVTPWLLSLSLCACVYFLSRFVLMIHLNTFGHLSSSSRALLLLPVCPRRYLNSTPPHIYISSIVQSSNLEKKKKKRYVWLSAREEMTQWDNSAFRINTIRSPPTIILPPPPVHRKTLLRLDKNNLSLALQTETPKNQTHAHWL